MSVEGLLDSKSKLKSDDGKSGNGMSSRSPCDASGIEAAESSGKRHNAFSSGRACEGLEGDCVSLDEHDDMEDVSDGNDSYELEESERIFNARCSKGDETRACESASSVLAKPRLFSSDLDDAGRLVGARLGSLGLLPEFFLPTNLRVGKAPSLISLSLRMGETFRSISGDSRCFGLNIVHGRRSLSCHGYRMRDGSGALGGRVV